MELFAECRVNHVQLSVHILILTACSSGQFQRKLRQNRFYLNVFRVWGTRVLRPSFRFLFYYSEGPSWKIQLQKQNFLFSKLSENKTFTKWLSSFKYRAMLALFASREIFLFLFLNTGSHFVGLTGLGPGWPPTYRYPPASSSSRLGLKACVTRTSLLQFS